MVCAAVSCPPLLREAYTPDKVDAQLKERMMTLAALPHLNTFNEASKTIGASKIFEWFASDFNGIEGLAQVIAPYAPEQHRTWLASGQAKVTFIDYNNHLNQQKR